MADVPIPPSQTPPLPPPQPAFTPPPPPLPPVQAPTPPVATAVPAPIVPEPEEDETLSELSPFNVLQKKGTAPLPVPPVAAPAPVMPAPPPRPAVAPAPAPSFTPPPPPPVMPITPPVPAALAPVASGPFDDDVDKDLAVQAAPHDTFVLPAPPKIPPPPPAPVSAALPPRPTFPPQQFPQAAQPQVIPPLPISPAVQSLPTIPPPPPAIPSSPTAAAFTPQSAPEHHHGPVALYAGLGALVALIILIGGLFALALNGTRVPVLYGYVSGLPSTALAASQAALPKVAGEQSYKYESSTSINLTSGAPAGDITTSTTPVYKMKTEVVKGQFTNSEAANTASFTVSANGNTAVPFVLRTSSSTALAYFPAGTSKDTVSIQADQVNKTLLAATTSQFPVSTVIKAVQTETAYGKQSLSGRSVATYNVTYNCGTLQAVLPSGMTMQGCSGSISYYWKGADGFTNLPVTSQVSATLTYLGKNYSFSGIYQYGEWNQTLGNGQGEGDLVLINNVNASSLATAPISGQDVISRLGIGFDVLPHDPSIDAPVVAPVIVAVTPSGATVTSIQTSLTGSAPVPPQPATAEGIQRDAQRKKDLLDLQSAIEAYKKDKGTYPVSAPDGDQVAASSALFTDLLPTYITAMPIDPLSGTYYYFYQSTGTTYTLRSILEDATDSSAKQGGMYSFYEVTN